MDTKRIVLTLVTVAALVTGARHVADAAPRHRQGPPHRQGALSLAAGRAAIDRYAANLRDAVAGARADAPMQSQVRACRQRQGVVTCVAAWTFAEVRCTVEINAVADRGVLVEELGEATCTRPPTTPPGA